MNKFHNAALSAEEQAMDIEQMSDPKRHPFKTNGFPVEQCLTCGWPERDHTERTIIG